MMSDEPSEISQEGRIARFARWEKIGVDAIEADLNAGGSRYLGGPPEVRALAREWVRMQRSRTQPPARRSSEIISLKPGLYGVSIDLKEIARRARGWFRRWLG
jgi:hypothetical protein